MITKRFSKDGKKCKATFSLPKEATDEAKEVLLLGEFNNWDLNNPVVMKKQKDGSFKVSLDLKTGRDYQFRYLIDRLYWENDWKADDYVHIPDFDIDNSVVFISKPEKAKAKTKKKAPTRKNATIKTLDAKSVDDLKKIEGIGPKIAGLLKDKGIISFTDLSKAKVGTLRKILKEAGSRYKMHDPSTWAKQAKLAATGKWDELKDWQDTLKGGRN